MQLERKDGCQVVKVILCRLLKKKRKYCLNHYDSDF